MLINLRNALMTGKRTPTAKDYVQSGLVAMWDGIENTGWGQHDENTSVWTDLISGTKVSIPSTLAVTGDSLATSKRETVNMSVRIPAAIRDAVNRRRITVEFVGMLMAGDTSNDGILGIYRTSAIRPLTMVCPPVNSGRSRRIRASLLAVNGNTDGPSTLITDSLSPSRFSVTCVFSDGAVAVYVNGASCGSFALSMSDSAAATSSMDLTFLRHPTAGATFNGEACAFRFYDSALTADEIARNYAIDKARFGLS